MWKVKAKVSGKNGFHYVAIQSNVKSVNRGSPSYHKCKPLRAIMHPSLQMY